METNGNKMERGLPQAVLVLLILFFAAMIYGSLTGQAFTNWSSGQLLNAHKEREFSSIDILSNEFSVTGLPIAKKGEILKFIVRAGRNGVHTGFQVENAISGLRFEGKHCHPGSSGDFCSNSYICVDDPKRCIDGAECFGDKLVEVRIPETQNPGNYVVSVCDGSDECCKFEIKEEFIIL